MIAKRSVTLFLGLAAVFAASTVYVSDAQMVVPEITSAVAAEAGQACLSKEQQRAAIAAGQAIPLAEAMHAIGRRPREVVKARLCRDTKGLVYMLTLLAQNGKVTRAAVDASNGSVISGR